MTVERKKEEQWLIERSSLVAIALRNCYITVYNQKYEDYRQIAYEALYKAHLKAKEEHKTYQDGYYYQCVVWRIQNERRKNMRQANRCITFDEVMEETIAGRDDWMGHLYLEQFKMQLSDLEREIFDANFNNTFNAEQIAEKFHCSASKVYKHQRRLIEKFKDYLDDLFGKS